LTELIVRERENGNMIVQKLENGWIDIPLDPLDL